MQSRNCLSLSDGDRPKSRGNYTGERLARERPKIYRQIIELLAQGTSVNRIARQCAVSRHTVRAVREQEAVPIAQRKQTILATFTRIAQAGSEAIEAELAEGKIKGALLVPVVGMSVDKILALSNDPQQINVNVSGSLNHAHDAPSIFQQLRELANTINEQAREKRLKAAEAIEAETCPAPTLEPPPPLIQAPPSAPSVSISLPE